MDLLLILTYTAFCIAVFKIFKLPLNKWTVPTAILGGIALIGTFLLLMNYNHPYAKFAKEVYVSVPIVPAVKGITISVEAQPNKSMKKGDVLFRIDPKPFQLIVAKKEAELADAEQQVKEIKAGMEAAEANVARTKANLDRTKQAYERYAKGNKKNKALVFSELEVENRRQLYLANEAAYEAAKAEFRKIQLSYQSNIDGVNTIVAKLTAELETARYDLERTTIKAPADGFVTHMALRPGVMAANLPFRPSMVFIPDEKRVIAASFWQNSLLRMEPNSSAEIILDAVPGHVFKGKYIATIPVMSEGDIQASGQLTSASEIAKSGRAIGLIELEEDLNEYHLPRGMQGKAAIYSEHFSHVSIIRKVLLRMMSWINYLFPIK